MSTHLNTPNPKQTPGARDSNQSNVKPLYPVLGDGVPTFEELELEYGTSTEQLCQDHEQIIESILEEEEALTSKHRSHIDEVVSVVKDEMALLNEVDKPGSDIE